MQKMSKQHEITVTFLGERNAFDNDTSRVIIGNSRDLQGQEVTIKGDAPEGELKRGLTYRFWGYWTTHHAYGRQFVFSHFVVDTPADEDAVVAYLQLCRGIGKATAYRLWNQYGSDAVDVLSQNPERVAREIRGITIYAAGEAAEFLRSEAVIRRAKMDLLGLLNGRGIPKTVLNNALRDWGSEAASTIKQNPYLLMRYPGCGFAKADKLYLEFGHNPARMKRQSLCCWYAVRSSSQGDTWFPVGVCREKLSQSIAGAQPEINRALALSLRHGSLVERYENGQRWVTEAEKAFDETLVAQYVAWAEEEAKEDGLLWPAIDELNISEHQREELGKALQGPIALFCGSPGTGKTYTAGELIKSLIRLYGAEKIAACAPTGKAAVRLTDSLQRCGIDEIKATTIHTLLKVETSGDGGWTFQHNNRNKLPHKFIVVDEVSMLDIPLMRSLLSARNRGTFILFIGDVHQLAPVGHGNPLQDLIAAGVACGTLTEIRRNSGRIVKECANIRDHKRFTTSPKLKLEEGENLVHIECEKPDDQIESMISLLGKIKSSADAKYDVIWDVQVLVPVNKKSPLARKTINKKLQDLLNPSGQRAAGNPFRVGDKLINLKNGSLPNARYTTGNKSSLDAILSGDSDGDDKEPEGAEPKKVYVANGEQGEVVEVTPARTIVRLTSPDRLVIVPRSNKSAEEEEAIQSTRDDGDANDGDAGTGCNWDLGFAISGHKFQGSEQKIVIVLIDDHNSARMVQSRQYVYTVLSRAKEICFTIGKKVVADEACKRDGLKRKTFLVEKIREERRKLNPVADVAAAENEYPANETESDLLGMTYDELSEIFCRIVS